jgi:hypothetical protein
VMRTEAKPVRSQPTAPARTAQPAPARQQQSAKPQQQQKQQAPAKAAPAQRGKGGGKKP